ncbi:PKD domain-containing protein [Bacteroidales bacterium OttesenSCG-928-B11]|nr:PKD domain-containing protein [Bacteroidales bacterium OttesenSCG-928-B11]MDL2326481.1 PKD domain-containing protein [Bacteroidales bacterium OttesenSCG-928-A14]
MDSIQGSPKPKSTIKVPSALMKEPIVQEMLKEISIYNIKVNANGMLEIPKENAMKVVDLLQHYTHIFEATDYDESYPRSPILCAFEEAYNFYSLRRQIEEEILYLEEKESLTDYNDPDNHHIVDPCLRTILDPNCAIIIEKLICVHYKDFAVGIMNNDYKALKELYGIDFKKAPSPMQAFIQFRDTYPNAFILSTGEAQFVPDFYILPVEGNPDEIQFINTSYSEEYQNMQFVWDFGDGHTSKEENPIHKFDNEEFTVELSIMANEGVISKKTFKGSKSTCFAGFITETAADNPNKIHFFAGRSYTTNMPFDRIVSYHWNFGDGQTLTTSSSYAEHTYSSALSYNVTLTITTEMGCSNKTTAIVTLLNASTGCEEKDDGEVFVNYEYSGQKYRIKSVLNVKNNYPFYRITATTVHYKILKNGNKVEAKTPVKGFGVRFKGEVNGCTTPRAVDQPWEKEKKKSRETIGYGFGTKIEIARRSMASYYYIQSKSSYWEEGVVLHNK